MVSISDVKSIIVYSDCYKEGPSCSHPYKVVLESGREAFTRSFGVWLIIAALDQEKIEYQNWSKPAAERHFSLLISQLFPSKLDTRNAEEVLKRIFPSCSED